MTDDRALKVIVGKLREFVVGERTRMHDTYLDPRARRVTDRHAQELIADMDALIVKADVALGELERRLEQPHALSQHLNGRPAP